MDDVTPEFSPESPLLIGDDDGSPARLVLCQAYWGVPGHTWIKGELAWVAGAEVDDAIARRYLAPVAQPQPTPTEHRRVPAAPTAPTLVEAPAEEVEPPGTYSLDDVTDPGPPSTPRPRPRPSRSSAA